MDKVLRFSDYDVFAYILSGLDAMLIWDLLSGTHWIISAQWNVSDGVAIVLASYIFGHVVAWPAAWLIERRFVAHVLGRPSKALFSRDMRKTRIKRCLFPDYFTPLDEGIIERVEAKADGGGKSNGSDQGLFWKAFARAKRDPSTYARMEVFLKLYGFCRNIAFVGLIGGTTLLIDSARIALLRGSASIPEHRWGWCAISLLVGIAMLFRFLKFYRLYSIEVFIGYAELPATEGGSTDAN
jgi:hypothetical protein